MDCQLTSLPFLAEISDNKIKSQTDSDSIADRNFNFKQIPVYMQAVEGCVKLVTEAPEKNCGAEFRDGFIRNTLFSRLLKIFLNATQHYFIDEFCCFIVD